MRRIIIYLCNLFFFFAFSLCYSQTNVRVSEPRVEKNGLLVHIYYDIMDSDHSEKFSIGLEIIDESGVLIPANALDGDIGENVSGGMNKQIIWDPSADNIFLNAYLNFQVSAKYSLDLSEEMGAKIGSQEVGLKSYNRTNLVLQSLLVPGLGMSRITQKPHWLRAVAGYGCITGSLVFRELARSNYNSVDTFSGYDDKRDTYDLAIRQDNISEVLFYTSVGIWVIDFIWTLIGTKEYKTKSLSRFDQGVSFSGSWDFITYTPTVGIRYRF